MLTHRVRVDGAVGVVGNCAAIQAREDAQQRQALRQHAHRQVVNIPQLGAHPAGLYALPGQPQAQCQSPSLAHHLHAAMHHTADIDRCQHPILAEAVGRKGPHHLEGPVDKAFQALEA